MPKKKPPVPKATREDIRALVERFTVPSERLKVRNWPMFARALAREVRRYGVPAPHWLNYPRPATTLRAVKRPLSRSVSPESAAPVPVSDLEERLRKAGAIDKTGAHAGAILIGGLARHPAKP